jgi:hypothetical protein
VPFREAPRGEALAIVWLKVVTFRVARLGLVGIKGDCLPSTVMKLKFSPMDGYPVTGE